MRLSPVQPYSNAAKLIYNRIDEKEKKKQNFVFRVIFLFLLPMARLLLLFFVLFDHRFFSYFHLKAFVDRQSFFFCWYCCCCCYSEMNNENKQNTESKRVVPSIFVEALILFIYSHQPIYLMEALNQVTRMYEENLSTFFQVSTQFRWNE